MGGILMHGIEMSSDAVIYIPGFIEIGSGIQKLLGKFTNTQTARRSN
jgi:hypothetical protein